MKALLDLFPVQNFSLLGVILFLPLLGAFVNGVWGKRIGREGVRLMTLFVMFAAFAVALVSFAALDHAVGVESTDTEHAHVKLAWTAWQWLTTNGAGGSPILVPVKFSIDALSSVMVLVITGVGSLIHLYASSYMKDDPGYARFFAYLNLFVFSMLTLVMADNMPLMFVGWEGVGVCSYLLIGFWYDKEKNAAAGKKAFIANRVGDFGLLVAMFLLAHFTGALDWDGIQQGATKLLNPEAVHVWPIGGGKFGHLGPVSLEFLNPHNASGAFSAFSISAATAIGLALLLGATGKSAQIPLYVWLPDAMAGPTPVSALIHAATMVTAGIYLVCRLNFVFVLSPFVMMTIAIVGAATAFLAATIAIVQNDLKKVLAYSTVSQLGFMFLGVGMGGFTAGFFHVLTHAFFKACLFLGAGSVIHAMHARVHDDDASQDMRNMGGLHKHMPLTFWTFLVATAAIIGFPFTSGFFSKDEILFKAFSSSWVHPAAEAFRANHVEFYTPPPMLGKVLFAVGVVAAALTAFYMVRALILTFFGDFKGWKIGKAGRSVPPPALAHDAHGDADHHHDDLTTPGAPPHESPRAMTIPLIVLATLAAIAGLVLNPTGLIAPLFGGHLPMEHWLDPVFEQSVRVGIKSLGPEEAHTAEFLVTGCAVAAFLVGTGLAYWMYVMQKGAPAKKLAATVPWLHRFLLNKWFVDEAYDASVISGVDALADSAVMIDRSFIDFLVARVTAFLAAALGTLLRAFQTGVVHVYAAFIVVGLGAVGWFYVLPHPAGDITDLGDGKYQVVAAPGPGYVYSFNDGSKDTKPGPRNTFDVTLEPGASKTIDLKVRNALNLIGTRSFVVSRPAAGTSPTRTAPQGAPGNSPTQGN